MVKGMDDLKPWEVIKNCFILSCLKCYCKQWSE